MLRLFIPCIGLQYQILASNEIDAYSVEVTRTLSQHLH
jgi:hypothetical protein